MEAKNKCTENFLIKSDESCVGMHYEATRPDSCEKGIFEFLNFCEKTKGEHLIDLLHKCNLSSLMKVMNENIYSKRELISIILNGSLVKVLISRIRYSFDDELESCYLFLEICSKAYSFEILKSFNNDIYELPFTIYGLVNSDLPLVVRRKEKHILLGRCVELLSQFILKEIVIMGSEISDEILVFISGFTILYKYDNDLINMSLCSLSYISEMYPSHIFDLILESNVKNAFGTILYSEGNLFKKNVILTIFINITSTNDDRLTLRFLESGLITNVCFNENNSEILVSLSQLIANILISGEMVLDYFFKCNFMNHYISLISPNSEYMIKIEFLKTILCIISTHIAVEFFTKNMSVLIFLLDMIEFTDTKITIYFFQKLYQLLNLEKSQNSNFIINSIRNSIINDVLKNHIRSTEVPELGELYSMLF